MKSQSLPPGGKLCYRLTSSRSTLHRTLFFKLITVLLTYFSYLTYKITRRVFAVVAPTLKNGSTCVNHDMNGTMDCHQQPWAPFASSRADELIGGLGVVFLSSYAVGMFLLGSIAEKMDLRWFLGFGMSLSSIFCCFFGLAKILHIHSYAYFVFCELVNGLAQSTGYPALIACMGNWFGFGKRGFVLALWNSNSSIGSILGSVVAGSFVDSDWSLSFIVPALIMSGVTLLVFMFLVPFPESVGCQNPNHATHVENVNSKGTGYAEVVVEESSTAAQNGDNETVPLMIPEATEGIQLEAEKDAIGFLQALKIPGVIEYSLCLFFNKLVSYSFIYWLPTYIKENFGTTTEKSKGSFSHCLL